MRWVFLLLVLLNCFYYVWHRQQGPARAMEVPAVSPYRQTDQRISLLAESRSPTPAREADENADVPGDESCIFLGRFVSEDAASAVSQRLLSIGVAADVQSKAVDTGMDYWVHLKPLPSRQASIRQLRELQSRAIDSYVITVGELENGISLGIFSGRSAAEAQVARLRELGYAALVRELPRAHREHWVRVPWREGLPDRQEMLDLASRLGGAAEYRRLPCGQVAVQE